MSSELDNIDELEALLADLEDLEEPAPKKADTADEPSDDELAELAELEIAKTVEARQPELSKPDELDDLDELESALAEFEDAVVSRIASAEKAVGEPLEGFAGSKADFAVVDELAEVEGLDEVIAEVAPVIEAAPTASAVEAVTRRRGRPRKEETKAVSAIDDGEEPGHLTPSLKTFIEPDQLQGDLEISEANLSKAMIRQAPLFARYSALAAKAQFQADRADQQVDLVEANLDSQIRDDMTAKAIKITENLVKAAIIRHPDYQKAVTRYNEAKAIAEMVKTAADSFRHRRDMLIQMGADRREEMKGAVRVQEHPGSAALRAINGES